MSKLNSHNLDVQRMLNVLQEAKAKVIICSLFSHDDLNDNLEKIKPLITNEELLKDIEEHKEKVNAFHDSQIVIPEDLNAIDKESVDDEDNLDDEGQPKDKAEKNKEYTDLKNVKKDAPEVIELSKSIRNFCRKYYHDKEFINMISSFKKNDDKVQNFLTDFEQKFNTFYEKCMKMTLEEEQSESSLNISLKTKIEDLKTQIANKSERLKKLQKERSDYNEKCKNDIESFKKQIEDLRKNTTNNLNKEINKINAELNRKKDENEKNLKDLREKHLKAEKDLIDKKDEDEKAENATRQNYTKARGNYEAAYKDYDSKMFAAKSTFDSQSKEKEKNAIDIKTQQMEFDAVESKYNFLKENFLITQQKCKQAEYDKEVKQKAVEWIQGQFRGYMTRKQLRKKYKFLNVLREPKIKQIDENAGKKGKK